MDNLLTLIYGLVGYLAGSIPFGLILTRAFGYGDLRLIGSGNIGATNALRTGNRLLAFLVLVADSGKGAAIGGLVKIWLASEGPMLPIALLATALGAVLGHNFPVWLKFKGGKGVATTLGVMAVLSWPLGIATSLTWLAVALVSRYSSLAALISFALSPAYALWLSQGDRRMASLCALLAFLAILRHRQNIHRLLNGQEGKISFGKTS